MSLICVKRVNKMSVEDIARFIRTKSEKMKKEGGGKLHKKQTGQFRFLPAFLVGFLTEILSFIILKLRISIPAINFNKNAMGSAGVSSVGPFGFEDGIGTFPPFANWSFFLVINALVQKPVVEGDRVVIGNVMNCNFTIDHRYVDGDNCSKFTSAFKNVFEEPEKYMDITMKKEHG